MKCLESNKEDTANAIEIIGEMTEYENTLKLQINDINTQFSAYKEYTEECKKREKRAIIVGNIIIPITTIPMIVTGGILMAANNDMGKPVFYTGCGLLVGCEVVWNGGRFIFTLW